MALHKHNKPNWNWKDITVEHLVILTLDLSSKTYMELLLPHGFFHEMTYVQPTIEVLMDCLCFSHDCKGNHFFIWLMEEFGVPDSWTQLFKVSYVQNLQTNPLHPYPWLPLCLSAKDYVESFVSIVWKYAPLWQIMVWIYVNFMYFFLLKKFLVISW